MIASFTSRDDNEAVEGCHFLAFDGWAVSPTERRFTESLERLARMTRSILRTLCILSCYATWAAGLTGGEPSNRLLGPGELAASRDGRTLYVANRDARELAWLDVAGGKVTARVPLPGEPTGLAVSPDGLTLYVACADAGSVVAVLSAASPRLTATIVVGHTATGLAVSPDGRRLYVPNRFGNDVSVVDPGAEREIARVAVGREPVGAAVTPDGQSVVVIHHLPDGPSGAFPVASAVTFVDAETLAAEAVRLPNGSHSLRDVCVSPDGRYAYATHLVANFELVAGNVAGGWMNQNALSVLDAQRKKLVDTVFLDEIDLGAGNPWGVACTGNGATICVAHAGSRELVALDAAGLMRMLDDGHGDAPVVGGIPYHSGVTASLGRRIPLEGLGTRGLAVIGSKVYVAGLFSDTLDVVDLNSPGGEHRGLVRLGPEPWLSTERRGEMLFHDAVICYQHWQSCASCHPDARADGLNWDLLNDGVGNPKNTKSLLLAHATPPAMAAGVRPTAEAGVRAGLEHILFAELFGEDAAAIDEYLRSLQPAPSPRLVDGRLSPAAERGRILFGSRRVGCDVCHPPPLYTDLKMHDVGTRGHYDLRADFDTPTLVEVWRTAPYLHDGRYATVKKLLQEGRHGDGYGRLSSLSARELDDLVEFVLSL